MLESIITTPITVMEIILLLLCSLAAGILVALIFSYKSSHSSSLAITLALLPMAMCMVVMVINGNLGVAVAVAGGFALVRFRSTPGTGKEISAIFIDMTLGVILGMGYIFIALIFLIFVAAVVLILTSIHFGESRNCKMLKITLPEDYDYVGIFDDIFEKYHVAAAIEKVKTSNMGSLVTVSYKITMQGDTIPKKMLDELRTRNANLAIIVTSYEMGKERL